MNFKIGLLAAIIIISIFIYIYSLNPQIVQFSLAKDGYINMPLAIIVFVSFLLGAFTALITFFVIDIRNIVSGWKERRIVRRSVEARKLYADAVQNIYEGSGLKAKGLLIRSIAKDPMQINAYIRLADLYLNENKMGSAEDVLKNGLDANPMDHELRFKLMDAYIFQGHRDKAYELLCRHLENFPADLHALKRFRDMLIFDNEWHKAVEPQKKVVESIKGKSKELLENEIHLLLGIVYESARAFFEKDRLNDAVEEAKEILKIDGSFIPAHVLIGSIYYRQGSSASALKTWERAYRRYRHIALFMRIEDLYLNESSPYKIIRLYKRAIESNPEDRGLKLLLARLYLKLEMIDDAIREIERLIIEGEDSIYLNFLIGEAYSRRNRFDEALAAFKKCAGIKNINLPPFICNKCKDILDGWQARCPNCGAWNALDLSRK